jgi:hypothetical protein
MIFIMIIILKPLVQRLKEFVISTRYSRTPRSEAEFICGIDILFILNPFVK